MKLLAPLLAFTPLLQAQATIYPTPQVQEIAQSADYLPVEHFTITQLKRGEKFEGLTEKEGAYAIEMNAEGALKIWYYDDYGKLYAKHTLSQMMKQKAKSLYAQHDPYAHLSLEEFLIKEKPALPLAKILDWPDMPYRGVVEGYYGIPWSHEARMRQIEFYSRNKMNTYIWAPKDDPYHHGMKCREPYPEKAAAQIRELAAHAAKHKVKFVWAIHPANTVDWSKGEGVPDMDLLVKKLELMYDLGVRHFGVFVDDSNGVIRQAKLQARLCTYLTEQFINKKPDVGPVIMCPTGYSRAWTPAPWLKELGENLHPSVSVMWTGDGVVWKILLEGQQWAHKALGRPTFIWWNWPCTDYARSQLAMGRTCDLSQDPQMKTLINGFVSNPMENPEASKTGLFGVADYAWNIVNFDSVQNWKDGMWRLYPSNAAAMQCFANHNSDLGNNGHGFFKEESVEFAPHAEALRKAWRAGETLPTAPADAAIAEFKLMAESGRKILADPELKHLSAEIKPWLELFAASGDLGQAALSDLKSGKHDNLQAVLQSYRRVQELKKGERKPQIGYKVINPLLVEMLNEWNATTLAQITGKPKQPTQPRFFTAKGDDFYTAQNLFDEDEQSVWTQPTPQQKDEWYALDFGRPIEVKNLVLVFGGGKQPEDYIKSGQILSSMDGKNWQILKEQIEGPRMELAFEKPITARYLKCITLEPREGKRWLNIASFYVNRPGGVRGSMGGKALIADRHEDSTSLRPVLEPLSLAAGQSITLELPAELAAQEFSFDLGTHELAWAELRIGGKKIDYELDTTPAVAPDGEPASAVKEKWRYLAQKAQMPATLKSISLTNTSSKAQDVKLNEFKLSFKPVAAYSDPAALSDGNLLTAYQVKKSDWMPIPEGMGSVIIVGAGGVQRIELTGGDKMMLEWGGEKLVYELIFVPAKSK